jgi:tRNA(Arg) A34 adenosine deaminase TadA
MATQHAPPYLRSHTHTSRRRIWNRYNGTARGLRNCNDGGCPRCNAGGSSGHALDQCVCLHAEENALLEAGRERLGDNTVLYCNTCPCLGCSVKIIQSGVKEVVYHLGYKVYVPSFFFLSVVLKFTPSTRFTRTETMRPLLYSKKLGLRSAAMPLRIHCSPGAQRSNDEIPYHFICLSN